MVSFLKQNKKILFIDNTAHHLYTQKHLYSTFAANGYQVILCCPDDGNYFHKLQQAYNCIAIAIDGKSMNPIKNLLLIRRLSQQLKSIKPDLILSFTIKPNIYSAIIGRRLNIPVVPNITGLGYMFLKPGIVNKFIVKLYRFAFANLDYIFFQNKDDKQTFLQLKIITAKTNIIQLSGSGVDLSKFAYTGYVEHAVHNFLYIGRLLWDKGIRELVEAFRIVCKRYPVVKLKFIGNYFPANPSAIHPQQIKLWEEEFGIEYLGMVDNVSDFIIQSSCIVLPSYREGMPRAILEASSMGKPVITTDTVGCRDSVDDRITGFLCNVKDAVDLADKMIKFIELPLADKIQMGINGRAKMEREFDQKIVIDKYFFVVNQILANQPE